MSHCRGLRKPLTSKPSLDDLERTNHFERMSAQRLHEGIQVAEGMSANIRRDHSAYQVRASSYRALNTLVTSQQWSMLSSMAWDLRTEMPVSRV